MVKRTILTISAKCSDLFSACLVNDKGETIAEHEGYVLDCMPGEHYGDYVMLDIDAQCVQVESIGTLSGWQLNRIPLHHQWP